MRPTTAIMWNSLLPRALVVELFLPDSRSSLRASRLRSVVSLNALAPVWPVTCTGDWFNARKLVAHSAPPPRPRGGNEPLVRSEIPWYREKERHLPAAAGASNRTLRPKLGVSAWIWRNLSHVKGKFWAAMLSTWLTSHDSCEDSLPSKPPNRKPTTWQATS